MVALLIFHLLLLVTGQGVFASVVRNAYSQDAASYNAHLKTRQEGYPGLQALKDASDKFSQATKAIQAYNGDLSVAQVFFQQAYEGVQLLDQATKELQDNPSISFFQGISYNPVSNKFLSIATTLSKTLVNKKQVLLDGGWGENTYQLLDGIYRSGSNLLRTYFSKRGGLIELAAGGFESQMNNIIGNARENFRSAAGSVVTSTVIVYAPAPTAGPGGAPVYDPTYQGGAPYSPPPAFQQAPGNQKQGSDQFEW